MPCYIFRFIDRVVFDDTNLSALVCSVSYRVMLLQTANFVQE
jgi:hypothetical protein